MNPLRELIKLYLTLNPEPADAQVHALAAALGIDKESLEATMYEMLGKAVDGADSQELLADVTDILDGNYQQENTPADELIINDGDTNETDVEEDQALTYNDGALPDEVALTDTQDLLNDDGVVTDVPIQLLEA